jgi:inorganic triphosphatase YgiF
VYFDTPKSKLRKHGLVLRIRHSGSNRLQTIKALQKGARGSFGRNEWEERIAGDKPVLKLANGTALEPLATKKLQRKLKPEFETVVERAAFPIRSGEADLELAVDHGHIEAREPVSEIEIELKHGDRSAIATIAERLANRFPWPIRRSPNRSAATRLAPVKQRKRFAAAPSTSIRKHSRRSLPRPSPCLALTMPQPTKGRYARETPRASIRCASACVACARDFDIQRVIAWSRNEGGQDRVEMAHRAARPGPRF